MRILYDSICINAFCLIADANERAHYSKLADPNDLLITVQIGKELSLLGLSSTQILEEDLKIIFEKRSGITFNQITQELEELEFYRNKMPVHADDYNPAKELHYYPYTENLAKLSFEILKFILQVNPKPEVGFDLNQSFDEYINHKKIELKLKLIKSLETLMQTGALSNLANQGWQIVDRITGNEIERLKIRLKRITEDILRYYAKYKLINDRKFKFRPFNSEVQHLDQS